MSNLINTASSKLWWDKSKRVNNTCTVCGYLFRDKSDYVTGRKFDACAACVDTYYYPNADAWDAGWRPNLEKKDEF
jgi:transposase-like protein